MTSKALLSPADVWSEKIYSNGWTRSHFGNTEDVLEKATGKRLGSIGIASSQDVAKAAAIAREAQKAWASVPGPKRGDVLREFARLALVHADEIADQIVRETGSIRAKALWEVQVSAREVLEAATLGSQPQGVLVATAEAGRQSIARRIPVGVIGIITPWNSPFILGSRAIGPALAMGNAVILKPDVQTPIAGGVTFARLFEEAGLPVGLFHVIPGGADTGAALVSEPLVEDWLKDVSLGALVNKRGTTWRGLDDAMKAAAETKSGAVALMIHKPSVIKRPVLVVNGRVKSLGFVADQYAALFAA